jgi:hypothetical protein
MVATVRLVGRSTRVTASSRGAPRSPGATLAIHSAHRRRRWPQRAQGRAVARRRPRWSPGRSGPPCRRRPAPKEPRRPRSRTRRREGGMTAANRPRSKAGTVTPVPVGVGGGWVDREVLGCRRRLGMRLRQAAPRRPASRASVEREAATAGGWRGWHGPAPLPGLQSGASFRPTPDAPSNSSNATRPPRPAAGATGRARGSSPTRRRRILAVASSSHRWCGSFSDPRGQFVGAIAFTRGCERNFWSFAQTTWARRFSAV